MKIQFLLFLLFCACGTTKKVSIITPSTPLPDHTTVEVIGTGQQVPSAAKIVGSVKIGDDMTATKNCTYDKVIQDAQDQARAMGGNLLQIKKHTAPNAWSTCHRIECDVYKQ